MDIKKVLTGLVIAGVATGVILGGSDKMTPEEAKEYIDVMNHEIRMHEGQIELNMKKSDNLMEALEEKFLERIPTKAEEAIHIRGKGLKADEYKNRREFLFNKTK